MYGQFGKHWPIRKSGRFVNDPASIRASAENGATSFSWMIGGAYPPEITNAAIRVLAAITDIVMVCNRMIIENTNWAAWEELDNDGWD